MDEDEYNSPNERARRKGFKDYKDMIERVECD